MKMKLLLLALGTSIFLGLSACATSANQRALYASSEPKGPWHDYDKRQDKQER